MKLCIGLGNPGKEYEKTRHNAGFLAINAFVRACERQNDFFLVGREKHGAYEAVEYEWARGDKKENILCIWPQLFMNRSGEVVRERIRSNEKRIAIAQDLVVLHDDIDIQIGKMKIDGNASSGGHKGVQNIIDQLGTKAFIRFRIGIRPVRASRLPTEEFVLKRFSKEEEKIFSKVCDSISLALAYFFEHGLEKTQNLYNKK